MAEPCVENAKFEALKERVDGIEQTVTKMQQYVSIHEDNLLDNKKTHEKFETRFSDQATWQAVTDVRYETLLNAMNKVEAQLAEMAAKPAKRWDSAVSAGLGVAVGAFITWIVGG